MEQDPQPGLDATLSDQILARHRNELIAIAATIVRDRHEAEDVVQDTIAATLVRLPAIAPDRVSHYLSRAVRRNAIKRRARRREFAVLDDAAAAPAKRERGEWAALDPFELEEAIASLPRTQQTVLRMKYYLDMSFRQIGDSLSISTHTAASRCRYAIAKLRAYFNR